jgi:hypothetical protein
LPRRTFYHHRTLRGDHDRRRAWVLVEVTTGVIEGPMT